MGDEALGHRSKGYQAAERALNTYNHAERAQHSRESAGHYEKAAAAGGEWDEAKHPRDASGKFGG